MFPASELIEALHRRARRSLRPLPPPGEFPPSWRDWFAGMVERPGRMPGAPPDALVAVLAARPPASPPKALAERSRWHAFATLWRQEWEPAPGDERWPRIASTSGSLLVHLLLVAATALLSLRFGFLPPQADARDGEEHVLQVEYVGEGAVAGGGGAAPDVQEEAPVAPAVIVDPAPPATRAPPPVVLATEPREAPAAPEPVVETVRAPLPVRDPVFDVPPVATPEVPVPARELQVTEVDVVDQRFQVPPPREVAVDAPQAVAPAEVGVVARRIELQAPAEVQVPEAGRGTTVSVAAAPPRVTVRERGIELAREGRQPAAATPAAATGGTRADTGAGARGADAVAGAGPATGQPPGALPSTRANDDWGDSTRNVDGRQAGTPGASGLFNSDGSPRLADGGRVGGGLPPGTLTEDFENIDRRGTWLKRPPIGYEPTSFDRFWLPSESLLEEWVRMSVTEVRIPIPGTTKSIRCVTVMLAMGGACGIVDPNLQEQPAQARVPPDVPFKRELQQDQDSLGPPPPARR